jgi:hypothetical protein
VAVARLVQFARVLRCFSNNIHNHCLIRQKVCTAFVDICMLQLWYRRCRVYPSFISEHLNSACVSQLQNFCNIIMGHECQAPVREYLCIHAVNSILLSQTSKLRTLNEAKHDRAVFCTCCVVCPVSYKYAWNLPVKPTVLMASC